MTCKDCGAKVGIYDEHCKKCGGDLRKTHGPAKESHFPMALWTA